MNRILGSFILLVLILLTVVALNHVDSVKASGINTTAAQTYESKK